MAANLQAVGLEVEQVVLEPGTFLDQLNQKELNDIFFSGTLPPPDAHFVYFQLECAWRYSSGRPELDALIKAGTQTADLDERLAIYDELRAFLDEDPQATIPMYVTEDLSMGPSMSWQASSPERASSSMFGLVHAEPVGPNCRTPGRVLHAATAPDRLIREVAFCEPNPSHRSWRKHDRHRNQVLATCDR